MFAKVDKRVMKTKRAIYEALSEIMLTKNGMDISVTELCKIADIDRKTFYTHYGTINDVINEIFDVVVDKLADVLDTEIKNNESAVEVFAKFIVSVSAESKYTEKLLKSTNSMWLMMKFQETLSQFIQKNTSKVDYIKIKNPDMIAVVADYISSGIVITLCKWAVDKKDITVEEIAAVISRITINSIQIN